MSNKRTDLIEEHLAHLQKVSDELSDIVARQETEIAALTHRVKLLIMREAEREVDGSNSVPLADRKPPHW